MKVIGFHIFPIIAVFLLAACGPSFEEKGFASEEEAERLAALGFPTFSALMERGRFQDAKQAREAVSKGFYELDDYESALWSQYQDATYSLEDVMEPAKGFSKVSLGDSLLGAKIIALASKYQPKREFVTNQVVVTATATPEICELMSRGLEQIQDESLRASYASSANYACDGVPKIAATKAKKQQTNPASLATEKRKTSSFASPRSALVYNFRCTGVKYTGYTGDLRIDSGSKTATWMKMDYKEDFTETDSFWSAYFPTLQMRLYFDKRTDLLTITDKFDREDKYQC